MVYFERIAEIIIISIKRKKLWKKKYNGKIPKQISLTEGIWEVGEWGEVKARANSFVIKLRESDVVQNL